MNEVNENNVENKTFDAISTVFKTVISENDADEQ